MTMKIESKKRFSYANIIFRSCQILLVIGIVIQALKVFTSSNAMIGLVIYLIVLLVSIIGERKLAEYIKQEIEHEVAQIISIKDHMFSDIELPVVIIEEVGNIKWCNKAFNELLKEKEIIGKNIKSIFVDAKIGEWILENQYTSKRMNIGNKSFDVMLEAVTDTDKAKRYVLYFIDCTEQEKLKLQIEDEKTIIGYLCIDNIDEITHSIEEVRQPMLLAIIDRKINLWFKEREVVLARIERDKYMLVLTCRELKKMEETKFDILDELRKIQVGNELPVTISIGIGNNLTELANSKEDARIAFDLAQGRGGDQAIIKYNDKYTFYGGKTKEVEKSTRVKARIKAYAFKELLHEADKVVIMGHKNMDMDCLGAAMGVYRGAAIFGKKAQIVLREPTFAIQGLYDRIVASKEYDDLFVTPEDAIKEMNKDTLLVIVDTHRKSYLESLELLEVSDKVVVFDHHRRSTDYVEEAVLTYIEPFISSTCEMIAEILNYLGEKIKLNPIEADALLAGITIDTKNFVFKAGVRTFEAAAFLRRSGADSTRVRMLFQNDMNTYRARAQAIQMAEVWRNEMAVAVVNGDVEHITIIAAQVADELLNVKGIKSSFVLSEVDECIYISARALGDTNVQRIMELLGGGGHLGIAGAQLRDSTIDMAKQKLKEAIELYIEEGESK
ncbi:MAG: DHH family phosphoesterase [Cellulosilyticum sp.]|nr:DHH family phosphoesterase [Cellulosilyticum sp.]